MVLTSIQPTQPSRRGFLAACAGCLACATCPSLAAPQPAAENQKLKLRLVFTHIAPDKPTWPYQGYDYEARKQQLAQKLRASCPSVEFLTATAQNAEDAKKLLENDGDIDGYLVYMLGIWTGVGQAIAAAGRPTLFVDDLYAGSGEFLIAYAAARRKGLKVAGVSSSRFEDVVEGIRAFECLKKLRSSVILDVLDREPGADARAISAVFGATVRPVSSEELNADYQAANRAQARECAARWVKAARKVVEPSREEIDKSGAMYLAMQSLMEQHKARALTIDCLRLFYGGKLPAYPCLGLFQFNNDGLVGACEADLQSTLSMLLMGYLVGRPGYISDPVIDTAKNQIIYAHCVAPSKVFGPGGRANPYDIRNHSEDRKGAAVRSLMPLGEMTTTLKFNPARKEVILHQGKSVENIDEDKACRTKLAVQVPDVDKLLAEWDRWGWHRVTFYGDWKRAVETVSALAGFQVVMG